MPVMNVKHLILALTYYRVAIKVSIHDACYKSLKYVIEAVHAQFGNFRFTVWFLYFSFWFGSVI